MFLRMYAVLEQRFPTPLKRLIPRSWRIWAGRHVWQLSSRRAGKLAPARPVPLPAGESEDSLHAFLARHYIHEDGPSAERGTYLSEAFRRLLYTLDLVPPGSQKLLEIGANPYFLSLLLQRFTTHQLTYVNYFGPAFGRRAVQTLVDPHGAALPLAYDNVNLELEPLPYPAESFDIVLLCEVIEHLTQDPQRALLEIRRVLRPGGVLILTTPNVGRLENIARQLAGDNIYDPYSAYGPYGRHNREYTPAELRQLMTHTGFVVDNLFTSDVHDNLAGRLVDLNRLRAALRKPHDELGQYIFVRARLAGQARPGKLSWLYRSYPESDMAAPPP